MVATSGGRRTAEVVGDAPWLPRLEVSTPKFVEGLARVADVISTDGTLPAGASAEALAKFLMSVIPGFILQMALFGADDVADVPGAAALLWPRPA